MTKEFCITKKDLIPLPGWHTRNNGPHADEALLAFCDIGVKDSSINVILDIGSAKGVQTRLISKCGFDVHTIDMDSSHNTTYVGDFLDYQMPRQFDGIWCSHTLEHQLNPNLFLQKIRTDLRENGLLALTVPLACYRIPKHKVVSGHVSMWNAGQLLYNLILARFDCSEAMVRTYGYNVSIMLRKKIIKSLPSDLTMNKGDIERLSKYFPFNAQQGFDGNIKNINWPRLPLDLGEI